ncbi:MBL fold metallo-hydrolase [Actinomadura madurae]|uniref:MBL fold metallo-hydrolase n=1 Tax=Actinomadura madurae TaxID=1993 RepID=UPI00399AA9D0
MCDVLRSAANQMPEADRRRFLKSLSAAAAAGGLIAAGSPAAAAGPERKGPAARRHRTRLVLLGTAGGPGRLAGGPAGVSTAVVYEDRVYLVDLGAGSLIQLSQSGLGLDAEVSSSLARVSGVFFTHLHSDHVTDWPGVYATGTTNAFGRMLPKVQVFGPGDRGTLPRVFPPGRPAPPVVHAEDPTPGITGMTSYLSRAFAQDFNDRARDNNLAAPESLFDVHDIDLAGVWDVDAEGRPPRLAGPLHVWDDGDVRVTATLVDHHPTAPAFGYRFDTPDGSVVISGDTTVSENLIDLAQGCDFLVHEVIDPKFVEAVTASLPDDIAGPAREHLLSSHTTIEQVGRDVAEPAAAKNLVLSHLIPSTNAASRWRLAQRGYSGRLIVGKDLMRLGIGRP